jgi:hypothetical protein
MPFEWDRSSTSDNVSAAVSPYSSALKSQIAPPSSTRSCQTFYRWKKQFAGLGLQEIRELRSLRHENAKLKQLVADLTLDRHILQEIVRKTL